jgi:hypothetical protein
VNFIKNNQSKPMQKAMLERGSGNQGGLSLLTFSPKNGAQGMQHDF